MDMSRSRPLVQRLIMLPSVLAVAALVTPRAVTPRVTGRSTAPVLRLVDQGKNPVEIIATTIGIAQADIVR